MANFDEQIRRLIDEIRRYSANDLVLPIARQIRLSLSSWDSYSKEQPWSLLFLLKLIVLHGRFSVASLPDTVARRAVRELTSLVRELEPAGNLPSQYDHHRLFIRTLAHQQFIFQEKFDFSSLARQRRLFNLPEGHRLGTSFFEKTGIDLKTWLSLTFALASIVLTPPEPQEVFPELFGALEARFTRNSIVKFLDSLSFEIESLRNTLLAKYAGHSPFELQEQSLFLRRSLLKEGSRYVLISQRLLLIGLGDFVYDTLREIDSSGFMNSFGKMFEGYVRDCLESSGLEFLSENQIKQQFGKSGKTTDFAVIDLDAIVLIEAKGVDIGHKGMTVQSSEILARRTENSAIKGLLQGDECARRILGLNKQSEVFLLVVTYKQLYLGDGSSFLQTANTSSLDKNPFDASTATLKPENVYFIVIDELEMLLSACRETGTALSAALFRIRQLNSNRYTSSFLFKQQIFKCFGRDCQLPLIQAEVDSATEELVAIMEANL